MYVRVSTGGQDVASQLPDMKRWLAAHGKRRRVVWYRDTFIGATLRRPGMEKIESDIQAGRLRTLVIWRHDRLGRMVRELLNFLHALDVAGVEFVSVRDGGVDASSAEGRLFRFMRATSRDLGTLSRPAPSFRARPQRGGRNERRVYRLRISAPICLEIPSAICSIAAFSSSAVSARWRGANRKRKA